MVDPVELIGGVYSLSRNENFWEYLIAQGIEENKAHEIDRLKPLLRISLEGKKVTISTEMDSCTTTSILRLNEEVEERIALDMNIKSHTTIEDNKLKICSEGPNGEVGTRLFEFSESEMIMRDVIRALNPNVKMVQLSGRYQVTENVNYLEVLIEVGIPEDKAKAINEAKLICSVTVDDTKVVLNYESPLNRQTTLEFGKESTEILPIGKEVKSTATKQGDVITVVSTDGKNTFTRTFTFNEIGVEMKLTGGSKDAIRKFKRL